MADIYEQLESCILLLDGGFGTMVQQYGLTEEDYRGERFREWPALLKGCNDLLALTRPEAVREIHVEYLQAGADIIETDSFNATPYRWPITDWRRMPTKCRERRRPWPAARPTNLRPATRRNPASWRVRWGPPTARPRCRPTWRTPRPAK